MPVAEIAAGAAAVTAEGGSTAAAAGVGAGGAAAGTGGGATAGGAAAGEGTAASGATAGGVSSYKAGQTGAVAAAKSGKVDASAAEAQSRAGRGNSAINLQNFSFGKKKNKDDNEKDDNLVSNENAMKLVIAFPVAITVSGIVSIILIVNMLVTFIYTGPLAITYPSFENSTENTAGYTNGDDVAKKLVKYYEQDYFKIWALNPDEVDYLHDYSNLRDVMMVYSMLIQTDKQKTDVPSYVSDLEDTEEGSLISKFFKAEIKALKSMISFVKWIFVTRQQINLLKSVYKEMFYWKVHYKVTKHGIKCKINIYNKTVDDYIDDHPELTEDQKNVLSVAKDSQYEWGDWDSSEYDAIAYQGGGSGNAMMRRHKDNYTICTLEDAKNFRSIYSARISDYLRMEAYGKNEIAEDVYEIEVDLTELKLMAGTIVLDDEVNFAKIAEIMDNISNVAVENKYSEWKRFKEKILDKAVRDINKNTNLSVSYETKRTGRGGKTSRVIFRVDKKGIKDHKESAADCQIEKNKKPEMTENKSMEPVSQKPEPTKEQLFEMCMEVNKIVPFSIDLDTCMTLIKDSGYNVSAVKTAVEVLKQQGGETKSPIGFLRKAVKENWKPSVVSYSGQKKRKSFDNAQKWEYDEDEIKDLEKMLLQTPVRQ